MALNGNSSLTLNPLSNPVTIAQGGTGGNNTNIVGNINTSQSIMLPSFRKGIAKVISNTGNCVILCAGDSQTLGYGALGTGGTFNNALYSFPQIIARTLNNYLPTFWANYFGSSSATVPTYQNDTRLTVGSGWSQFSSATAAPGGLYLRATSATSSLAFTPDQNVNTFDIYYAQNSGLGTFSWQIDSGSTNNVATAGTGSVQKVTCTATAVGQHSINLNWVSGASGVYIAGIVAYDSTKNYVNVINAGWAGSKSGDWNQSAATSVLDGIGAIAPDLTLLKLNGNDWLAGTSIDTFKTNMQAIIDKCKLSGDVILMTDTGTNPGTTIANAAQIPYVNAVYDLAQTNNCIFLDNFNRLWSSVPGAASSWDAGNTLGWQRDGNHFNSKGYSDEAEFYLAALLPALPSPQPYTTSVISQIRTFTGTGAITATLNDYCIIVNKGTGAATTVNLPASVATGQEFVIVDGKGDAATNNITLTPNAGNINGSATYVMNVNRQATKVKWDGSNYYVI